MRAFFQRVKKAIKWRLRHWTWGHISWVCSQHYRKWRMRFLSPSQRECILNALPAQVINMEDTCVITITFGSRQFGNRDNLLKNFLNTFLKMTEDPRRFEIFIKIDFDDDLLFFYRIKKRYGQKINLRFFPSERRRGYADMHIWHSSLIQKRSPNSRALLILSEDARFTYKHWDKELIARMDAMGHDYFIGTPCSLEEAISIMGPNPAHPVPVYWIRGDDYPILSFPLLSLTARVAQQYPNWTCLGNLFNVDGFPGDILRSLWLRHKINCHMRIPLFFRRQGVFCWTANPKRAQLRNETLLKFFLKENQDVRNQMADAIAQEFNKLSLVSKGSR